MWDLHWLYWIASFAVVVGLLCILAAVQEWWLWRLEERLRATMASGKAQTPPSESGTDR